jgi:hypothetical protein
VTVYEVRSWGDQSTVGHLSNGIFFVIAKCGVRRDAEMVCAALNRPSDLGPSSLPLGPQRERLAGGARPNPEDVAPAPSDERGEAA